MAEPLNRVSQFPQFPLLPPELRQQIWRLALPPLITGAHTVQVEVYGHMPIATHYCVPSGDDFCQSLPYCTYANISEDIRPQHLCLFDGGYFKEPNKTLAVSDSSARSHADCRAIGLACQEARQCTLERFPQTLRVFQKRWSRTGRTPNRYRTLRFHPRVDVLLINRLERLDAFGPDARDFPSGPGWFPSSGPRCRPSATSRSTSRPAGRSWARRAASPCCGGKYWRCLPEKQGPINFTVFSAFLAAARHVYLLDLDQVRGPLARDFAGVLARKKLRMATMQHDGGGFPETPALARALSGCASPMRRTATASYGRRRLIGRLMRSTGRHGDPLKVARMLRTGCARLGSCRFLILPYMVP
ncbi:hypothetical protein PG994_008565 [Apiospora phragmitis]|uniref:2EXR domain-containing protein n=1 Tax=Apiospora phragmitis TaxID=2905665 RepID=A0ABR1UHD5_9PEZI